MKAAVGKLPLVGNRIRIKNRAENKKPEGKRIRGCRDMEGAPHFD